VTPLFIDLDREWRGGQSQALLLLKGLYERGHAAELLTVRGSLLAKRARQEGIYVHTISGTMRRLGAAAKIRALLADGRFELVHVNEPHALTSAWLAGAHKRLPLVVSRRVAYPIKRGHFSRARYLAAQRILTISHFVKKSVLDSGIPAEIVELVYEGVEVPSPVPPEARSRARQRWSVPEHEILLGCVGYLLPEKGQEFVLRALPAVREKFPGARLIFAGDGPCRPGLEVLSRALGLTDAVIFAGFVRDVTEVYAALDAFVFPSLAEPLGTSLLAAMAWGLPVVAVASGGVPEYVENKTTGLLVAHADPAEFAAAMQRLLLDSRLRKELGEAGREEVKQRFSADLMVENTLRVYEEVLQSP